MIFIKQTFTFLLTLVLVLQISCVPISDYKEVFGYLQNFGYLSNDEKTSLNQIVDNHESVKSDNRLKRALKNLQRNGNIPITGKYDKNTATLMETPRCGVSDKNLNIKRHKRYTLMSTKWSTTNLTYRFDHDNKDRFMKEQDNIRRIIREAFNVWEKDTIMKFIEETDGPVDILISFVHPKHTNLDPYVLGSNTLAHAFQPGKGLGGDAHFNEKIDWDFNVSYDSKPEGGKISFFGVALHELGHSLGLGHTRDNEAVMYEFYSRSTSTLAEDDIRGMQHIYGVPPNRKYTPPPKKDDSQEEMPVWGQSPMPSPHKCNSSYDAIALIDDELIAFKRKYMFGPNMNTTLIRSRWLGLSPKLTHVDAVFQTSDKKILFFVNQGVYSFDGSKTAKTYKLSELGIDSSALKIDAIFRKSDNDQIYIFVDHYYYRFDEKKMTVTGNKIRVTQSFKDVFDIDTAFTYKDGVTYFFKNESFYEFDNKNMRLNRMKPGSAANYFMNCDVQPVVDLAIRFDLDIDVDSKEEKTTIIPDYIDLGPKDDEIELDCNNPERAVPCEKENEKQDDKEVEKGGKKEGEKGDASSIKSFSFLVAALIVTRFLL